ncbi:arginine deiminase family protein [Bacillus licheniformis]|nr:arginine deiminase family protein [Bacillus licheniformis]
MKEPARRRESLFMRYIINHHPRLKDTRFRFGSTVISNSISKAEMSLS